MTDSRRAFRELLALLGEIDERYVGEAGETRSELDVADGHRLVLHGLRRALGSQLEADPHRPVFHRAVSPTMKFGGDSPDAIYHECNISTDCSYVIRGNVAGAVYVSFSIQAAGAGSDAVGASINSDEFDVAPDGSFEILIGQAGTRRPRNWLEMPAGAMNVMARHYFEERGLAIADPERHIALRISTLETFPAPPEPTVATITAGIERVTRLLRSRTLEESRGRTAMPSWVSRTPNRFNEPEKPGAGMAYAAIDIAYAMAPFYVPADKALVMSGRFPACRYAGVVLWSRFRQSFDYVNRTVSLNRAQTVTDAGGNYRIVVAQRDPGVPNWLDTGGRSSGMIYWRFLLPEEPVAAPRTELVDLDSLSD